MKRISRSRLVRVFGFVFLVLVGGHILVASVFAGRFTGDLSGCLSASGHAGIISVNSYACPKAAASNQNICASWLSAPGHSTTTMIDVPGMSGTTQVYFYGMCTDRDDTTSNLWLTNDNGSITGFSSRFFRTKRWGNPSSQAATLNIDKFIQGLSPTVEGGYYVYTRAIYVWRSHSDAASTSYDISIIKVRIIGGETPPPPPPPDTCDDWGTPPGYVATENHGFTDIDIRIKNEDARFNGYGYGEWNGEWHSSGVIYAMPTDKISWRTCYWPGVQETSDTEVSSVNGVNWGNYRELRDDICQNEDVTYKKLYEVARPWENNFRLWGAAANISSVGGWSFDDSDVRSHDDSVTIRKKEDVGQTLTEYAQTYHPIKADIISTNDEVPVLKCPCCPDPPEQECDDPDDEDGDGDKKCTDKECTDTFDCWCCTNTYTSDLKMATVNFGPRDDEASVIVPYNFTNYTGANIATELVYSGEGDDYGMKLGNIWVTTTVRDNPVTKATYATRSPNGKIKLFAYVTENEYGFSSRLGSDNGCGSGGVITGAKQCLELEKKERLNFNDDGDLTSATDNNVGGWNGKKYNAFDATAGNYVCFVSAVFPAETPGNTIIGNNPDWSGASWRYSDPDCAIIAKRPSFQVWGGDMYTNSTINTTIARKRNVYNGYRGSMNSFVTQNGSDTNYGSWAEEGLVIGTSGGVTTSGNFAFASGAALGYRNKPEKANTGVDGSLNCSNMAPLTIANSGGSCGSPSGIDSKFRNNNNTRRELIDYWINSTQNTASGAKIVYSNAGSIGNATVPYRQTWIYDVNDTFTITGNVKYSDSYDGSNTLRDIPKVIIYADNVDIQCNVTEVDAIIITKAGGKVRTCSNAGGDDSHSSRGKPLKIFGMVITDSIELGRTYGGAAWGGPGYSNGQQAAAEVFDFDSSILLWSEFMASAAETDTMQVVYQNEIAPRY